MLSTRSGTSLLVNTPARPGTSCLVNTSTRSGTSPIGVRGEAAVARGAQGAGKAGDRAGRSSQVARGLPDPARHRCAAGAGGGALAVSTGRSGGDAGAAAVAGAVWGPVRGGGGQCRRPWF